MITIAADWTTLVVALAAAAILATILRRSARTARRMAADYKAVRIDFRTVMVREANLRTEIERLEAESAARAGELDRLAEDAAETIAALKRDLARARSMLAAAGPALAHLADVHGEASHVTAGAATISVVSACRLLYALHAMGLWTCPDSDRRLLARLQRAAGVGTPAAVGAVLDAIEAEQAGGKRLPERIVAEATAHAAEAPNTD
ncbi:MAG TPA: hypothetical protein VMW52_12690 [Phycisphaerae bacterium]|nr:hypothetical protein [Phycisphaerae bacterium]